METCRFYLFLTSMARISTVMVIYLINYDGMCRARSQFLQMSSAARVGRVEGLCDPTP